MSHPSELEFIPIAEQSQQGLDTVADPGHDT